MRNRRKYIQYSFLFSGEKIGKKNKKEARGVKISGHNTLKQREREYKGVDTEKDSSRLLILLSQNKVPTCFVNISHTWQNVFLSDNSFHR